MYGVYLHHVYGVHVRVYGLYLHLYVCVWGVCVGVGVGVGVCGSWRVLCMCAYVSVLSAECIVRSRVSVICLIIDVRTTHLSG